MKNILLATIPALLVWFSTYAFMPSYTPSELAERQNKQAIRQCIESISYEWTVLEVQKALKVCKELELIQVITPKTNTWTATGAIIPVPSQWYTKKHSLVLTGSHDYRIYSDRLGASWKNNNSAGLTWGVSNTLKELWNKSWIRYKKGSPRPINEKGYYIYFETVEDGLRAKIIAIRERWGNATVQHYLNWWGTDHVELSFDKSKIIKDLTDWEFTELFVQQMKKESPWYTSQLVKDWILIIE